MDIATLANIEMKAAEHYVLMVEHHISDTADAVVFTGIAAEAALIHAWRANRTFLRAIRLERVGVGIRP